MTGTWTDSELDAALLGLADVLDPDPTDASTSLAVVRERLTGTTSAPATPVSADVVDLGAVGGASRSRRRWAPAVLVAAAVVAAVTLAAVFWPRGADRATPASPSPTVTSSAARVQAELALLPVPLPTVGVSYTVITTVSGVGDRTVSFAPVPSATDLAGNPVQLSYNLTCGDPTVVAGGTPRADAVVSDDTGEVGRRECSGIADGVFSSTTATWSPAVPTGHDRVTVDVPGDDVVWKLTVTAASLV